MDEREQAGEGDGRGRRRGGGEGKTERKRAVTGIQIPAEKSLAQKGCFVIL